MRREYYFKSRFETNQQADIKQTIIEEGIQNIKAKLGLHSNKGPSVDELTRRFKKKQKRKTEEEEKLDEEQRRNAIKQRLLSKTQEGFNKFTRSVNDQIDTTKIETTERSPSQSPVAETSMQFNFVFPHIPTPLQIFSSPDRSLMRKSVEKPSVDRSEVKQTERSPERSPSNSLMKTLNQRKRSRSTLPPKQLTPQERAHLMISEIVENVEQHIARKKDKDSFLEREAANPFPKFFESISFFDDEGHYHLVNNKQFMRLQQLFDEWYGYK